MTGGIRQPDNSHLAAGARAALDARHHGRGDPTRSCATLNRARDLCPGLDTQFLEHRGVILKRMSGQEKPDRLVFAAQPLSRQPGFDLWERDLLTCPTAAAQFALADRCRVVRALRTREHGIHSSKDTCAVLLEQIERSRRGEAFEYALVHGTRI